MAIKSDKFEAHCIEMAKIAVKVGTVMDLKNDALQACFATILISGDKHGIFLEPTPKDTKTPVIPPEPAAVESSVTQKGAPDTAAAEKPVVGEAARKDAEAARKADDQIKDVPRTSSSEQDAGQRRTSFLAGIQRARELLNKEGHVPPITPAGLNTIINAELKLAGNLGSLDMDDLEKVLAFMSAKLDTFRANQKAMEDDAPF